MGGKSSKSRCSHHNDYGRNSSHSAPRYSSNAGNYMQPETINRVQKKYSVISDNYQTLNQVTEALAQAGLESSNLIVGIDFTKSNEWTGKISFNRRSLHSIGSIPNPYQQAISIIGRTLAVFDEDNLIPCFGFGDASTHDQEVFSFYPDNQPCNGFENALQRYKELVPNLRLAGPTSFAPIIETAISIVDSTGGQYHVLLIIADGQVTRSVDTQHGQLSQQERDTMNAIVRASDYPLSIVMVGVGDGPWDMMREFDDNIPSRAFDNFQFVNFTEIMSRNIPDSKKEAEFALSALMEIPSQYKATIDLQLLGRRRGTPLRLSLPPPVRNADSAYNSPKYSRSSSFDQAPAVHRSSSAAPSESSVEDKLMCSICLWQTKDLAFGCGHQQRVMVRVTMRDGKSRSKALRTAVALPGVTSAAVEGDMIIVVGDGIDSVALTVMLRKQMGFAELHRVAPFDEKQEKKGSNSDGMGKNMQVLPSQVSSTYAYVPYPSTYQNHDPYYNQSCNIM